MAKFDYIALDSKGQEQKGSMDAPSQKEALTRLGQMGLHPTSVDFHIKKLSFNTSSYRKIWFLPVFK